MGPARICLKISGENNLKGDLSNTTTVYCVNVLMCYERYCLARLDLKQKIKKHIAVDVLFKAYPMVPLSLISNLAGQYLYINF
jgi:hypothetical protein